MLKTIIAWILVWLRGFLAVLETIFRTKARAIIVAVLIWLAVLVGTVFLLLWLIKFVFGIGFLPVGLAAGAGVWLLVRR